MIIPFATAKNNVIIQMGIDPNLSARQSGIVKMSAVTFNANALRQAYPFIPAALPVYTNLRVAVYLQPPVVKLPFIIPEPANQK